MAGRRLIGSSSSLRFAILLRDDLDTEIASLAEAGIRARRAQTFGELRATELSAPGLDALLSLAKYDDVENLGCAYCTGIAHVELATRVVESAHAVPTEILDVLARSAQDPEVRFGALKVAGQAYADPREPGAGWGAEIAATVAAAMRDDEPAIRLEAALVSVRVGSKHAAPFLRELLEREGEPAVRSSVEDLLQELGQPSVGARGTAQSPFPLVRLAFPVGVNENAEAESRSLDSLASAASISEVATGVRLYERRVKQARMRYLVDEPHAAACAYFDGKDPSSLALEAAYALHFVPIPVARAVVSDGPTAGQRVSAIVALAMAASNRVLPDGGVAARQLQPLLEALSADSDTHVQQAATSARTLLAAENP